MPLSYLTTLQLIDPAPQDIGPGIHAVLHELIHRQDPNRAAQLHQAQRLPLSLGWARYAGFGGLASRDRQTVQVRIHCLDDSWQPLLLQALAPGTLLKRYQGDAGRLNGRVVGLLEEQTPLADLEVTQRRDLEVHFISPTLLRSGEAFLDEPRTDVLLHGMLRRARFFSPFGTHPDAWRWADQTQLEIRDLGHVRVPHPKHRRQTVTAFEGTVKLHFPGVEAATVLTPVVRLAGWTGSGIKTLYGFGETVVVA